MDSTCNAREHFQMKQELYIQDNVDPYMVALHPPSPSVRPSVPQLFRGTLNRLIGLVFGCLVGWQASQGSQPAFHQRDNCNALSTMMPNLESTSLKRKPSAAYCIFSPALGRWRWSAWRRFPHLLITRQVVNSSN